MNQTDVPFRKRFSIAHELGHHFLHLLHDGDFVDTELDLFRDIEDPDRDTPSKRAEVQANQFAAALLMPEELIRTEWQQTKNVANLARRFNVSEEAMGIRLSRLGLA